MNATLSLTAETLDAEAAIVPAAVNVTFSNLIDADARAAEAIGKADAKRDKAELDAVYAKTGPLLQAAAFIGAGGRLKDLMKRSDDMPLYDRLSNYVRVAERFGTDRPARFTCWSAIVKAVTLKDEELPQGDGPITTPMVRAATAARKAPSAASTGLKGESSSISATWVDVLEIYARAVADGTAEIDPATAERIMAACIMIIG